MIKRKKLKKKRLKNPSSGANELENKGNVEDAMELENEEGDEDDKKPKDEKSEDEEEEKNKKLKDEKSDDILIKMEDEEKKNQETTDHQEQIQNWESYEVSDDQEENEDPELFEFNDYFQETTEIIKNCDSSFFEWSMEKGENPRPCKPESLETNQFFICKGISILVSF